MKGAYPGWDVDLHFVSSDSWFARPHQKVAACGNQVEVVGETLYVAAPASCPTHPDGTPRPVPRGAGASNVVLYTSRDAGNSFTQACLPSRDLDLGYSLLRTHDERAALLVVDHDEQEPAAAAAPVGNVYAPGGGEAAGAFSLSLPRAYRAFQASDVARVEGLPGVWLANQLDADAMLGGGGGGQQRPPRGDGARGHPSSSGSGRGFGSDRYSERVRTRVTFNGGGAWKDLSPPRHFTHAACARCTPSSSSSDSATVDPSCALHLHGPSSWHDGPSGRPAFYSHSSAPGVVMAVGNAGPHLDSAADSLCTWLSRDGGRSWTDVAPRASIYEFGNSGGVILSARHEADGPTDTISFSADGGEKEKKEKEKEKSFFFFVFRFFFKKKKKLTRFFLPNSHQSGHCFHEVRLSEAIDVQNIRVEPDGAAHVFVVRRRRFWELFLFFSNKTKTQLLFSLFLSPSTQLNFYSTGPRQGLPRRRPPGLHLGRKQRQLRRKRRRRNPLLWGPRPNVCRRRQGPRLFFFLLLFEFFFRGLERVPEERLRGLAPCHRLRWWSGGLPARSRRLRETKNPGHSLLQQARRRRRFGSAAAPGTSTAGNTDGSAIARSADPSNFPKCQCTSDDVECEFGFEPVSALGQLFEDALFFGGGGVVDKDKSVFSARRRRKREKRCVKVSGFDDRNACPLLSERGSAPPAPVSGWSTTTSALAWPP